VFLKMRNHLLRAMLMFADKHVNVIGHDRAGIARVTMLRNRLRKAISEAFALGGIKREKFVLQPRFGFAIKLSNPSARRLHALAPVVQFAEFRNHVIANFG